MSLPVRDPPSPQELHLADLDACQRRSTTFPPPMAKHETLCSRWVGLIFCSGTLASGYRNGNPSFLFTLKHAGNLPCFNYRSNLDVRAFILPGRKVPRPIFIISNTGSTLGTWL